MSVRELAALFFREIKWITLAFVAPVVIAMVFFVHAPRRYEASAKILVSGLEELTPTANAPPSGSSTQVTTQEVLNSEVEILTGRDLALKTIQAVGADRLFPRLKRKFQAGALDSDALAFAFGRSLRVRPISTSNVISLAFEGPTPELAAEALRRYLQFYVTFQRTTYAAPAAGFVDEERSRYEADLRAVDQSIDKVKARADVFNPDLEGKNLLDARSSLTATISDLRSQADALSARVTALRRLRDGTPEQIQLFPETAESQAMDHARGQLLDLKQQQARLAQNYQPTSRAVKDVQAQIETVSGFLDAEGRRRLQLYRPGRNPLFDELTADIARDEAQIGPDQRRASDLERQIAGINARLEQITQAQVALEPLQREHDTDVQAITAYRQKEIDAKLSSSVDHQRNPNVSVIQDVTAGGGRRASEPKILPYLLGGVAGGILAAAFTCGVFLARKNTFLVPESVEARTKVPVLVSVPEKII